MIISTTDNIQQFKILDYLGIVSGTDIYLVGGLLGGGLANQENLYTQALNNAISKMKSKATDLGANAIIGVSTNIVSPGNLNNIIVIATGTAVFAQQIENDARPKSSSVNTEPFARENIKITQSANVAQNKKETAQHKQDWLKKAAQQAIPSTIKRCPYCGENVTSKRCGMCGKEINHYL